VAHFSVKKPAQFWVKINKPNLSAVMFDGLDAKGSGNVGLACAWQADDILPAFRDMRFGFGIRFILGLERLCELWRIRSMVVPPI
jgi:hypothetical protein